MRYSLDTSAILNGWWEHYPPGVFPTVWRRLHYLGLRGDLIVTEEVLNELERLDEGAYKWVKDQPTMVVPVDGKIQPVVSSILAANRKLVDTQKNRHHADPFVIALASLENGTVVSGEVRSANPMKNPRIPDICDSLGIPHIKLVELLRQQGWSF